MKRKGTVTNNANTNSRQSVGVRYECPRRIYARHDDTGLWDMISNPLGTSFARLPSMDPCWGSSDIQQRVMVDIREPSPSFLLAACVDSEKDCFSVRDTRQSEPCLVVNGSTKAPGKVDSFETIGFVSDAALFTHQTESGHDGATGSCQSIWLWDVRKLNEPQQKRYILPSFPSANRIQLQEPVRTVWKTTHAASMAVQAHESLGNAARGSSLFGYSMDKRQCFRVDLSTTTTTTTRTQKSDCEQDSIAWYPWTDCPIQQAVSNDVVALYHPEQKRISVRNLISEKTLKRRRRHDDNDEKDPSLLAVLPAELHDVYGTTTRLTCMQWNRHGSGLVGGTADGDVFSWGFESPDW